MAATIRSFVQRLWYDDSGQALTEYALILALIAVVVVAAVLLLGNDISNVLGNVDKCLTTRTSSAC